MKTKIISFYCDINNNTYYSDSAIKFKNKCDNINIIYEIEKIESKNNWMLNCLNKPIFILNQLNKNKQPIIWMDIDTDILQPFLEFDNCDCDVGFIAVTEKITSIKASPIYFNHTEKTIDFLNDWVSLCENAKKNNLVELDHDALRYSVLPKHKNKLAIKILSEQYFNRYILNIEAPYSLKPNNIYSRIANTNKNRMPL